MILFPHCKINLGLHITRKRADGYHDLETVFYPLPLRDVLEVITTPISAQGFPLHPGSGTVDLHLSGLPVQGAAADNLCVKAWQLLKKDHPALPAVQLYLHKVIPMGAGLGGGSSDAAFTLRLLNDKYRLGIGTGKLLEYALQLGSDCPFFILNKPCVATGRGELMQPVTLDLSAYRFLLVYPAIHINTGWAFGQISPAPGARPLAEIVQQPVDTWKDMLVNDFEAPVCRLHPELQRIKDTLYAAGAVYASMTGSGSSFYGIFPRDKVPTDLFPGLNSYILNA